MKTSLNSLMLLAAMLLFACSGPKQPDVEQKEAETHDHTASPAHNQTHHTELASVQLNNGEKWEANRETTEGIHRMEMLAEDFKGYGNTETLQAFKSQMDYEFNQIIEQCTMTGEAHEQLHNYLIPLKTMINDIDKGDVKEHEKNVQALQQHLQLYSSFFS
jgi:hypothetical protein